LNKGADAFSRRYLLLSTLRTKVLGFEIIKELYKANEDFQELFEKCSSHSQGAFHLDQGFLLKESRLCVSRSGIRELLIQEIHGGPWLVTLGLIRLAQCLRSILLTKND